ncbi:AAA family ATPase [Kitasatospora sp. HPMI-4]|uniref:helix-turn-helix transcriptional regulator n=1 Tax=Kitasatospora sp. HPMI-4 TaxID=3448443 RepID=UPI003F1C736F
MLEIAALGIGGTPPSRDPEPLVEGRPRRSGAARSREPSGPAAAPPPYRRTDPEEPLGRDELLATAGELLREPGSLLLYGPAGIGKSAVATALAARAAACGATVLRCTPAVQETGLPFVGLIDLLSTVPDSRLDVLPSGPRAVLRAALLRGEGPADDRGRLALRVAVAEVLRSLAGRSPVLLVLDGLQWLDGPSAVVVSFLARRARSLGLAVLATERTPEGEPPRLRELCPPGAAELQVTPLPPLTVTELLTRGASGSLTAGRLREIRQAAAGNPLYALELARTRPAASPRPPYALSPPELPERLRDLLLAPVRGLSPEATRTLLLAAASTRPTVGRLRDAGAPDPVAALTEARAAAVLDTDPDGTVRFRHPLVRVALLGAAATRDRLAAHRALAAATTDPVERIRQLALACPDADERQAGLLLDAAATAARRGSPRAAYGLAALAVDRTPARAVWTRRERLLAAGEFACGAGLWEEARLAVLPLLAEPTDQPWHGGSPGRCRPIVAEDSPRGARPLPEVRRTVLPPPAERADRSPCPTSRVRTFGAAVRDHLEWPLGAGAAEPPRPAEATDRPPYRTSAARQRIRARLVLLRSGGLEPGAAAGLVAAGLAEAADDPVLEAPLRLWAARCELLGGRTAEAVRQARWAAGLAVRTGDAATRAACLVLLAELHTLRGEPGLAERSLDRARNPAVTAAPGLLLRHRALLDLAADRPEHARRAIPELLAALRSAAATALGTRRPDGGDRPPDWSDADEAPAALLTLVRLCTRLGDCGPALTAARETAAALAAAAPTAPVLTALALAELAGGELPNAMERARAAVLAATRSGDRLSLVHALDVLGRVRLLTGQPAAVAEAVETLQRARTLGRESGLADPATVCRLGALAEGLVALGEGSEAAAVIAEGRALLARAPGPVAGHSAAAVLDRADGLLLTSLGRVAEATRLLRTAAERLEGLRMPLEAASTLVALGGVERRSRRRAAARAVLGEAREICRTHGARPLLERVERDLARLGAKDLPQPGTGAGDRSAPVPAELTASEHRIAELVAGGATNREVAATLFVSVKTVEGTLSRVYRKLGVRSRTSLARALT